MSCRHCENYATDYGFCRISSTKPAPTGNTKTCPYYQAKKR